MRKKWRLFCKLNMKLTFFCLCVLWLRHTYTAMHMDGTIIIHSAKRVHFLQVYRMKPEYPSYARYTVWIVIKQLSCRTMFPNMHLPVCQSLMPLSHFIVSNNLFKSNSCNHKTWALDCQFSTGKVTNDSKYHRNLRVNFLVKGKS